MTGIAEKATRQAAEWWGTAKTSFLLHARGIEHHSHGVQNVLGAINIVLASGRIGRPHCGYATITGQANGQGGREHGQKADQLPGARDIDNPQHRAYVAGVWGMDPNDLPPSGVDAYEIFRTIDRGEIRGLLSICFNPLIPLPDNNYVRAQLEKLEFYVAVDFFMNETARCAHLVLPGSQQEEDEGVVATVEGRVVRINKAVQCPGEARQDWRIIQDIAKALGRERGFTFKDPGEIFAELRVASKGGTADWSGITYEKIERQHGVFWPCPSEDHPGTPRLFEPGSWNPIAQGKGPFYFPDGKARFNAATYTPPAEDVDEEYPIFLTTGRVISQFLSGTQTRRIGPLLDPYPEPRVELHPLLAQKLGVADGDWVRIESRRGSMTLRALVLKAIRPDTVFIPYHWAGRWSANQLTIAAHQRRLHRRPILVPGTEFLAARAGASGPRDCPCGRHSRGRIAALRVPGAQPGPCAGACGRRNICGLRATVRPPALPGDSAGGAAATALSVPSGVFRSDDRTAAGRTATAAAGPGHTGGARRQRVRHGHPVHRDHHRPAIMALYRHHERLPGG